MNYCFNAETIKEIENEFYKTADSSDILMERAGFALYEEIKRAARKDSKITVLTGSGNNGGDGYVAARLLKENGYNVTVCEVFAPKRGRSHHADRKGRCGSNRSSIHRDGKK